MLGPRLLLIDDSPDVASLVLWLARRTGQTVTVASSAETGLHVLDGATFDLILVDVNLPGMDGIEFCRRVLPRTPQPPLAVFLQSGLGEDLLRAVQVGVEQAFYKDHMKQPDLWATRSAEILAAVAGRCPAWLLPWQQDVIEPLHSPHPHLPRALETALGHQRAATLGALLLARAWQRVLGAAPVDLTQELTPRQGTQVAVRLIEGLWRLLGTAECRGLRVALEPVLPGLSGGDRAT